MKILADYSYIGDVTDLGAGDDYYPIGDLIQDTNIYEPRVYTHEYRTALFSVNIVLASLTVIFNSALIYFISGRNLRVVVAKDGGIWRMGLSSKISGGGVVVRSSWTKRSSEKRKRWEVVGIDVRS